LTGDQHFLPVELELHARGHGFGGNELRLRLLDGGLLGGDLMADPADRCLLGRDLVARRIDREPVVAVVDRGDDIAGADPRIVGDANVAEIARYFRGQCRVVGLDVGVVGRNREPADREPVIAVPAGAAENGRQQDKGGEAASAGYARLACGDRRRMRRSRWSPRGGLGGGGGSWNRGGGRRLRRWPARCCLVAWRRFAGFQILLRPIGFVCRHDLQAGALAVAVAKHGRVPFVEI